MGGTSSRSKCSVLLSQSQLPALSSHKLAALAHAKHRGRTWAEHILRVPLLLPGCHLTLKRQHRQPLVLVLAENGKAALK